MVHSNEEVERAVLCALFTFTVITCELALDPTHSYNIKTK